jgi:Tol biopolymer transport system component
MTRSRIGIRASALLTVAGAVAIAFAVPVQAAWPGANGKIVFFKRGGTETAPVAQIYSMNKNGHGEKNLSAAGGGGNSLDIQPSVSPDGKRIAFARLDLAAFSAQIWVMNMNGSRQTNISNDALVANESGPAWSEDGSSVVFVRQPPQSFPGQGGAIWIRRADGSGTPRQLTAGPSDANPVMSPDGELLAFSRPPAGGEPRHLFVMQADGDDTPRDLGEGAKPDWSPDSKWIVYGQGGPGPIMVVKVSDPSQKRTLTGPFNEAPAWSPDGRQIVYADCTTGQFSCQIALMSASGGNQHDITHDQGASDLKPDWQPKGGGQEGGD